MAGSQASSVEEESCSELPSNRDVRLALLVTQMWRDEIERAVDRIKKSANRTKLDRWFRKQWYMTEARRRKEERRRKW